MSRIQCLKRGEPASFIRTRKESRLRTMAAQLTCRQHFVQEMNSILITYALTILLFGFDSNSRHDSTGSRAEHFLKFRRWWRNER